MTVKQKKIAAYVEIVRYWRGQILGLTVTMERYLDVCLASYFCKDGTKTDELLDLILCTRRITLSSKYEVFHYLVTKKKVIFDAKLLPNIKEAFEHRNVFAHYMNDNSNTSLKKFEEGAITLVKFQNTRTPQIYSKEKLEEIKEGLIDVTAKLRVALKGHISG